MDQQTKTEILQSIAARRLVIFAGAGLSIPAPSNLPSAHELAVACSVKHTALTTEVLPEPQRSQLEEQASHFLRAGTLESYYLQRLVDWGPFLGVPNTGHTALSDLMLCRAVNAVVTTNYDVMLERGAETLGAEYVVGALDAADVESQDKHAPYLKIHGCVRQQRARRTLWCRDQLGEPHWKTAIDSVAQWLGGHLLERDIVFLGFWTDWDYLNNVLAKCIDAGRPRAVYVVDVASEEIVKDKAPTLWQWTHQAGVRFRHLQMSGDEFLSEIRRAHSEVLLNRLFTAGHGNHGVPAPVFGALTTDDLYDLRRDWTGVPRNRPVIRAEPVDTDERLGRFLRRAVANGATLLEAGFSVAGRNVRVKNAAGRFMHSVLAECVAEPPTMPVPDAIVCVGAEDDGGVPQSIIRAGELATVVRPNVSGDWCTDVSFLATAGWE